MMREPHESSANTLTKRDLVAEISRETGITQMDVHDVLQRALDGIIIALKEGKHVEFREFGVFEVIQRKSRVGRNPNKPQNVVLIPDRRVVKFKPGKRMREMLSAGEARATAIPL